MHQACDYLQHTWVHRRQNIRDYVVVPHNIGMAEPCRLLKGEPAFGLPLFGVGPTAQDPYSPGPKAPAFASKSFTLRDQDLGRRSRVLLPRACPEGHSDTRENL